MRPLPRRSTTSFRLLDQVRAIGAERVRGYRGTLAADEYHPIYAGPSEMMSYAEDGGG